MPESSAITIHGFPSRKLSLDAETVLLKYAKDQEEALLAADKNCVFITHSGCSDDIVEPVKEYLESLSHFENIYITRAGGVVSSHCGPGTLGVLYYTDGE